MKKVANLLTLAVVYMLVVLQQTNAQTFEFNPVSPSPITVGQTGKTVTLKITNPSIVPSINGVNYKVGLTTLGLYFVNVSAVDPAKISFLSNVDGKSELTFTVSNLAVGEFTEINAEVVAGNCFSFPNGVNTLNANSIANVFGYDDISQDYTLPFSVVSNPSLTVKRGTFLISSNADNKVIFKGQSRVGSDLSVIGNLGETIERYYALLNSSDVLFNGYVSFKSQDPIGTVLTVKTLEVYLYDPSNAANYPGILISPISAGPTFVDAPVSVPVGSFVILKEVVQVTGCLQVGNGIGDKSLSWGIVLDEQCQVANYTPNVTRGADKPAIQLSGNYESNAVCRGTTLGTSRNAIFTNTSSVTAKEFKLFFNMPANYITAPLNSFKVFVGKKNNGSIVETQYSIEKASHTLTSTNADPTVALWSNLPADLTTGTNANITKTFLDPTNITNPISLIYLSDRLGGYTESNYNCIASFKDYYNYAYGYPLDNMDFSCLPNGENTQIVSRLVIHQLLDASNNQVVVDLEKDEYMRVEWDEYYCGLINNTQTYIHSSVFNYNYKDECGADMPFIRGGDYINFEGGILYIPRPGSINLAADPDRCNTTVDGQIETVSFDMNFHHLSLSTAINNLNGKLKFKIFLDDGLDMDMSFEKPKANGLTSDRGYNNLGGINLCNEDCLNDPKSLGGSCDAVANQLTNPLYHVIFSPKSGTPLDLSNKVKLLGYHTDGNDAKRVFYPYSAGAYPVKQGYMLYEVELDIASLGLTIQQYETAASTLQKYLNDGNLSFDLRAYCPPSKQNGGDPKSYMQFVTLYEDGTCPVADDYAGVAGYTKNLPLGYIDYSFQVNCPGCKIPGSNIYGDSFTRLNVGLVDANNDGFPDDNTTSINLNDPVTRYATNGDRMKASFFVSMSDGQTGVGAEWSELIANNYILDNLYLKVNIKQGKLNYLPGSARVRLGTLGTWTTNGISLVSVNATNSEAIFRVSAAAIGASALDKFGNPVPCFSPGAGGNEVYFESDFTITSINDNTTLVDIIYKAGYSICDNCSTDLIEMSSGANLTTILPEPKASLWCTNGGTNFKYITYHSEYRNNIYNSNSEPYVDKSFDKCHKTLALINWGEFGFVNNWGGVNFFPNECRYFYNESIPVVFETEIAPGYEVDEVQFSNTCNMSGYQIRELYTIKAADFNQYTSANRGAGKNSFDISILSGTTKKITVNYYYQHELAADVTNYNSDKLRSITSTTLPDKLLIKEENWYTLVNVKLRSTTACISSNVSPLPNDYCVTNLPSNDYNTTPVTSVSNNENGGNPNNLSTMVANPIGFRPFYGGGLETDKLLYKVDAPLQINNNIDPDQWISGNKLYLGFNIKNKSNLNYSQYPFLLIEGSALDATKGLTYSGLYSGSNSSTDAVIGNKYENYSVTVDNSSGTRVLVAYNRPGDYSYLKNLTNISSIGYYVLPPMAPTDHGYDFIMEFNYTCTSLSDQGCGSGQTALQGLNNDLLTIAPGNGCYGYPTFADIDAQKYCGLYTSIPYRISSRPYGTQTNYKVITASNTLVNPTNASVDNCTTFDLELDYKSCQGGEISGFDVELKNYPSSITLLSASIVNSNTAFGFTKDASNNALYHFVINDPSFYINNGEIVSVKFRFDVGCTKLVNSTLDLELTGIASCGSRLSVVPITFALSTLPPVLGLDNIVVSQASIKEVSKTLTIDYEVAGNTTIFDNTLLVEVTVNGIQKTESILIPSSTAVGVYTFPTSIIFPATCATYDVKLTLQNGYIPPCGYVGPTPDPACLSFYNASSFNASIQISAPFAATINTSTGNAPLLCSTGAGSGINLIASPSGTGFTYSWSYSATYNPYNFSTLSTSTNNHFATLGGFYQVIVSSTIPGCGNATAVYEVVNDAIVAPVAPVCKGENPLLVLLSKKSGNAVLGSYQAQWYDYATHTLQSNGIATSGIYYAAAIARPDITLPSCTLSTEAYPSTVTIKQSPSPYSISIDGVTGDFVLYCPSTTNGINLLVNNSNVNASYSNPMTIVWNDQSQTTFSNNPTGITVHTNGRYVLTAQDLTTGCVAASNELFVEGPQVYIEPTCSPTATSVTLNAITNYPTTPSALVWKQVTNPGPSPAIASLGTGTSITVSDPTILYTVEGNYQGCATGDGLYLPTPIPFNLPGSSVNQIAHGDFVSLGGSDCNVGYVKDFSTAFPCQSDKNADPLDKVGHFMINGETDANGASLWNNSWTGFAHNADGLATTGNEFLLVDGDQAAGDRLIWNQTVSVNHAYRYFARAFIRNIDLSNQLPVRALPELYMVVQYKGQGSHYGNALKNQAQVIQGTTNGIDPWIEFGLFSLADIKMDANPGYTGEATDILISFYMRGSGAIGRDIGFDDVELWPIGLCDDLHTKVPVSPCTGISIANPYQFICPGGSATITVNQPGPGVTYAYRSTSMATNQPVVLDAFNSFVVTPPVNSIVENYILTISGTGCTTTLTYDVRTISPPQLSIVGASQSNNCTNTSYVVRVNGVQDNSYTYLWKVNGVTDASQTTFAFTSTLPLSTGTILTCEIQNYSSCGSTTSPVATFTVTGTTFTADAGIDQSICVGNSTQIGVAALSGNTYSWKLASTVLPNPNPPISISAVTAVSPTSTTSYELTVTNLISGCSASDIVEVVVNALPLISAGADKIVCFNSNVTLTGSGGLTYTWDKGVVNNTAFAITASDMYTVTGTDANGCTNTDEVTVTVNQLPNVSAGVDQTVCKNSQITLMGSGAISYSWDNGVLNGQSFLASATIMYTVIGTDANGCTNNASVNVIVNPLPPVSAGTDKIVCKNTKVTLAGTGALSYSWDKSVVDNTEFTAIATNIYTVTGTDANGCTNTDEVTVTVNPLPNVSAGSDQIVCENSNVTLKGSGASTYSWNKGIVDNSAFTVTATDSYTVTGTDANGCSNTDDVTVTVNPLPAAPTVISNAVCTGGNVLLSAAAPGADIIEWYSTQAGVSPIANGSTYSPNLTSTTEYYVQSKKGNCVSATRTPVIAGVIKGNLTFTNVIDCNTGFRTLSVNVPGLTIAQRDELLGNGKLSVKWLKNITTVGTGASYEVKSSGNYSVQMSSPCTKNSVKQPITIFAPLSVAASTATSTICAGETVALNALRVGGEGTKTRNWTSNPNDGTLSPTTSLTPTASPTVTTDYTITIKDLNECTASSNVHVVVNPLPVVNAGTDKTICRNGGTLQLVGTPAAPPGTGSWTGPGITSSGLFDPKAAGPIGTYSLKYTYTTPAPANCKASDVVSIKSINNTNIPRIVGPTSACNSGTQIYTIRNAPSSTLNWTISNGTINGIANNNSNSVSVTFNGSMQTSTLTATFSGCGIPSTNHTLSYKIKKRACREGEEEDILSLEPAESDWTVELAPNPTETSTFLYIHGASSENIKIEIVDVNGKLVHSNSNVKSTEPYEIGNHFAAGVYSIRIQDGESFKFEKLVIIR